MTIVNYDTPSFVFILMTDLGINYSTRFISLLHSRVWATPLIAI